MPFAISQGNARLNFLDGLRGLAVALMVINHASRWILSAGAGFREQWIYFTVTLSAPIFLFLVGFCLKLSFEAVKDKLTDRQIVFKYLRRGVFIIFSGYIFNWLVFADESILSGKVLHSIGASIILSIPFLFLGRKKSGQAVILALALFLLFGFGWFFPFFSAWSRDHELIRSIFFSDFLLIPWFGFVLIGLLEAGAFLAAKDRTIFAYRGAVAGLALIAIFAVYHFLFVAGPAFVFDYDYNLNNHWSPNIVTLFWIIGMIFLLFGLAYFLLEARKIKVRWLIVLGQSAFFIYFLHHLVGLNFLSDFLGVRFGLMATFVLFDIIFIGFLAISGKCWLVFKKIF